eukprot:CAMPEP_0177617288 /NCGR_PEP_ID=MMETSP0419_2-20121207/24772_1 /TAXON_ID=582737 /ORGANISM="Tetraselmis sp., Strain GSL018" /LENGTH=211 /DNA_ID=CAMNT_0019115729 /DNA_START=342 /DNA_END=978 /DNA_ORIENTATION=+
MASISNYTASSREAFTACLIALGVCALCLCLGASKLKLDDTAWEAACRTGARQRTGKPPPLTPPLISLPGALCLGPRALPCLAAGAGGPEKREVAAAAHGRAALALAGAPLRSREPPRGGGGGGAPVPFPRSLVRQPRSLGGPQSFAGARDVLLAGQRRATDKSISLPRGGSVSGGCGLRAGLRRDARVWGDERTAAPFNGHLLGWASKGD